MTRIRMWIAVTVGAALLLLAGCSLRPSSYLIGDWVSSSGGDTETLTFTADGLYITNTGTYNGTIGFSFDSVCESAHHIKWNTTSTSGDFAGTPNGSKFYMVYELYGDSLYIGVGADSYPAVVYGPHIRQ